MSKPKKEPKLSPFAKLRADLEAQKVETRKWRDMYRNTMEGRMERLESDLSEVMTAVQDVACEVGDIRRC